MCLKENQEWDPLMIHCNAWAAANWTLKPYTAGELEVGKNGAYRTIDANHAIFLSPPIEFEDETMKWVASVCMDEWMDV